MEAVDESKVMLGTTREGVAQRRNEVWRLRTEGYDFDQIYGIMVERHGVEALPASYSPESVYSDLSAIMSRFSREMRETAVEVAWIELDRFDVLLQGIWPKAKHGDPQAVKLALQISDSRRKLLGVDKDSLKVDWRVELSELMKIGTLKPEDIVSEFGEEVLAEIIQLSAE